MSRPAEEPSHADDRRGPPRGARRGAAAAAAAGAARRGARAASWARTSPRTSTCPRSTRRWWTATRCGRRTCAARTAGSGSGESIMAGQTPTRPLAPGEAAVVMTGAPLPPGCDAVVMHERTQSGDGGRPDRRAGGPPRAEHPRPAAARCSAGDVVVPAGHGAESGAPRRAGVGRPWPGRGSSRPRVAVVSTGDELVEPDQSPRPGPDPQLERHHAPGAGDRGRGRGRGPADRPRRAGRAAGDPPPRAGGRRPADHRRRLRRPARPGPRGARGPGRPPRLPQGPAQAGQADLVRRRATDEVGDAGAASDGETRPGPLVFGLPGNPVSGLVGYLLFVRPALAVLLAIGPVRRRSPGPPG